MQSAVTEIDLHGMSLEEARNAIDDALRRADMSVYRIKLIHGFNNGTALRDMIFSEYRWHMKVIRISSGVNRGQTELILREY